MQKQVIKQKEEIKEEPSNQNILKDILYNDYSSSNKQQTNNSEVA